MMTSLPKPTCCSMPKFQNVTHVIFDLDGTILDTEAVNEDVMREVAESFGKKFTDEIGQKVKGTNELATYGTVISELGLDVTPEEFKDIFREKCDKLLPDVPYMPGVEKMIKHLVKHNIPIAIATSSAEDHYNLKASKKSEIFDLFHHVVCGSTDPEVKNGKPAPDIYLLAASRFEENPPPNKVLVFEDAANGMKAGLAAGMQVVIIPDDKVPCELWRQATLRIDSFEYMIPELFGLPPFGKVDGEGEGDDGNNSQTAVENKTESQTAK